MFNLKDPTKQMKIEMQFSISLDDMYFNSMAIKRFGYIVASNKCLSNMVLFYFNEILHENAKRYFHGNAFIPFASLYNCS